MYILKRSEVLIEHPQLQPKKGDTEMDDGFLKALEQIKKLESGLVVESIFKLFHSIEKMGIEELSASKRTLDLFRLSNAIKESENKILDQIDDTMVTRARVILHSPGLHLNLTQGHISFRSAFGDPCFQERINKNYWE